MIAPAQSTRFQGPFQSIRALVDLAKPSIVLSDLPHLALPGLPVLVVLLPLLYPLKLRSKGGLHLCQDEHLPILDYSPPSITGS